MSSATSSLKAREPRNSGGANGVRASHTRPPEQGPSHAFLPLALVLALATVVPVAAAVGASAPTERAPVDPETGRAAPTLYLTFDDGPSAYTPQVLDVLRRHDAHATFFVVGSVAAAQPALLRRIVRDGHTIGNHTYGHVDLSRASAEQFFRELERAEEVVRRLTGRTTTLLRPPYGATSRSVRALAARDGYRVVLWDVDPQDWRRPGSGAIAATVLAHARPGAIVLLHDGGGDRTQTVVALDRLLTTLEERGYAFRALR